MTRRFRIESALAALTAGMALLTIAWPEWIEAMFGVDPDGGNGVVEWGCVAVLALASLACGLLARADWAAQAKFGADQEPAQR